MEYSQLAAARRLAGQFGHTWGQTPDCVLEEAIAANDPSGVISAYWLDPDETGQCRAGEWAGICSPVIDKYGQIAHTSQTGRLHWVVCEGHTTVQITRPGTSADPGGCKSVLEVSIDRPLEEVEIRTASGFCLRHLQALEEAVQVECPDWEHAFFVEVDLGHSSQNEFRNKIRTYTQYLASGLYQSRYQTETFQTLVLTTTTVRRENLVRLSRDCDCDLLLENLLTISPRRRESREDLLRSVVVSCSV